ncbi:MAG: type II secretion system F family protein [Lachnospiraceae bacterium]|nr:type II secretion system F family protein [Lachnospiraceae bacterium]
MGKKGRTAPSGKNEAGRSIREKDTVQGVVIGMAVTGAAAWLFYDSYRALLLGMFLVPLVCRLYRQYRRNRRRWDALLDLRELLQLLSSYMQSGVSIENSFLDAEREMTHLTERESEVQQALHHMNEKVKVNVSVEQAFFEMAQGIQLEEAKEFADILLYAKRLGGNYIRNVHSATVKIQDKLEVNQEIETLIAEKKLELKVMIVMPIVMLSYIKITSYDFIAGMYHTPWGVAVMTGCLCLYMGMILLGNKIIHIQV